MRKTTRRRRGRPTSTTANLRDRLLDVALEEFANNGIDATPLRAVAKSAGVTPALLNYYFGNREQLLDTLVAERIGPLISSHWPPLEQSETDPHVLIGGFVMRVADTVRANPWLPKLWAREVFSNHGLLRQRLLDSIIGALAPRIVWAIADAQRNGQLNPNLDPRLVLVSLIGLTLFPLATQPMWRNLLDANDIDTDTIVRHTLALIENGLEIPK